MKLQRRISWPRYSAEG